MQKITTTVNAGVPSLSNVRIITVKSSGGETIDLFAPNNIGRSTAELYNLAREASSKHFGSTIEVLYK